MDSQRRYALLIGSGRTFDEVSKPIPDNIVSNVLYKFSDLISSMGKFSFGWTKDNSKPVLLKNPAPSRILNKFESPDLDPSSNDLLLLYYFGHGYVGEQGELCLTLRTKNPRSATLNTVLEYVTSAGFKKLLVIIDCCHSGLAKQQVRVSLQDARYFLMTSTDAGYARFDSNGGRFTAALIDVLRDSPPELRDKHLNAITLETWFQAAKSLLEEVEQEPVCDGNLTSEVLHPADEPTLSPAFNTRAPLRSGYSKLYYLLQLLNKGPYSLDELAREISESRLQPFMYSVYQGDAVQQVFISQSKIREYLVILRGFGFVDAGAKWRITSEGKQAIRNSGAHFNLKLIEGVFRSLPKHLTLETLNRTIAEILGKQLAPPNLVAIEAQLIKKRLLGISRKQLGLSLQLLSYAGAINRAPGNTYFPYWY